MSASIQSRMSRRVRCWAPASLVLGLVVGWGILTTALPHFQAAYGKVPQTTDEHWSAPIWSCSTTIGKHQTGAVSVIVVVGLVSAVLAWSAKPFAYLVYLVAALVVLFDLLLLFGAYSWLLSDALKGAG